MDAEADKEKEVLGTEVILEFISFGWRWGPPTNTVKNFNLRRLQNPPSHMLKRLTGLDKELQRSVFEFEKTQTSYSQWIEEVTLLLTQTLEEQFIHSENSGKDHDEDNDEQGVKDDNEDGENEDEGEADEDEDVGEDEAEERNDSESEEDDGVVRIRFGFGCHSGRHRSVAVVERLSNESCFQRVVNAVESQINEESGKHEQGEETMRTLVLVVQAKHRDLNGSKTKGKSNRERRGGRKKRFEERRQSKKAFYS